MFGFWKKAEKTVDAQVEDIKKTLKVILDDEGNVRPGVTGEQVRQATKTIDEVVKIYDNISKKVESINTDQEKINAKSAKIRQEIMDNEEGLAEFIRRTMPYSSTFIGL